MLQKSDSLWETTSVQNLIRYAPSGAYFARFRAGGKIIRQNLETTVFSVAKQRLPEEMRKHRAIQESATAFANGKMTVADAGQAYLCKLEANVSLKPRTKGYYRMLFDFVQRSWPGLNETDVRKISERDCETWLLKYQNRYAPTVVNNSIKVLRDVLQEAVRSGARFNNPASDLSRVRVRGKLKLVITRKMVSTILGDSASGSSLLVAWLSCHLLTGIPWLGSGAETIKAIECQMRQDGWFFDDIVLQLEMAGIERRCACSVKSHPVFEKSGAPIDFARAVWQQWFSDTESSFQRGRDCLALVASQHEPEIREAWFGLTETARAASPETLAARKDLRR